MSLLTIDPPHPSTDCPAEDGVFVPPDRDLLEIVTPWEAIAKCEELLEAAIRLFLSPDATSVPKLAEEVEQLATAVQWLQISLLEAYLYLTRFCLGNTQAPLSPAQRTYFPFSEFPYWTWAEAPFLMEHLKLGIIYALIGRMIPDSGCKPAAEAIADWHCQLLDHNSHPIPLFLEESRSDQPLMLLLYDLLFRLAAEITGSSEKAGISRALREHWKEPESELPALWTLIEQLTDQSVSTVPILPVFQGQIEAPECCMAGLRTADFTVIGALSGCNSSMGYLRSGKVQIVAFGPQALPLGDCARFGFDSPVSKEDGTVICDNESFKISRRVRLSLDPPMGSSPASYGILPAPHHYADVQMEYTEGLFAIDFLPYSFDLDKEIAFTFFIKATDCLMGNGTYIRPKSLDRYDGRPQSVSLQAAEGMMTLIPPLDAESMQMIPLAGNRHFWGADFLCSFLIRPNIHTYRWKVSLFVEG